MYFSLNVLIHKKNSVIIAITEFSFLAEWEGFEPSDGF